MEPAEEPHAIAEEGISKRSTRARKPTSYRDLDGGGDDFDDDDIALEVAKPTRSPAAKKPPSKDLRPTRTVRLSLKAAGLDSASHEVSLVEPLPGYSADELLEGADVEAAEAANAAAAVTSSHRNMAGGGGRASTPAAANRGGGGKARTRGSVGGGRGGVASSNKAGADEGADDSSSHAGSLGRDGGGGSRGRGASSSSASQRERVTGWGMVSGPICVCQRPDHYGHLLQVPCADGSGGCNGWVHPQCCAVPRAYWEHALDEAMEQDEGNSSGSTQEVEGAPKQRTAPSKPYICPLCIRAATIGRRERSIVQWSVYPAPLTPDPFVVEKILARRTRKKTPEELAKDEEDAAAAAAAAAKAAADAAASVAAEAGAAEAEGGVTMGGTSDAPASSHSPSASAPASPAAAPPAPQAPHLSSGLSPAPSGRPSALDAVHVPHVAGHSHIMTAEGMTDAAAAAAGQAALQALAQGSESSSSSSAAATSAAADASASAAAAGGVSANASSSSSSSSAAAPSSSAARSAIATTVVEYLIKWKWRSHLHCTWETQDSLVELELALAQAPVYDPATGSGSGISVEMCKQRVHIRLAKFDKKAAAQRRTLMMQSMFSGGSRMDDEDDGPGTGASLRGKALKKFLGEDYGMGSAVAADDDVIDPAGDGEEDGGEGDGDDAAINPEWTFAERVIASTAALGEDYFDLPSSSPSNSSSNSSAQSSQQQQQATPAVWGSQPLYLVKWKGLSYAECSWETGPDVGDDDVIRAFRIREALPDDLLLMQQWQKEGMLANAVWTKAIKRVARDGGPAPYKEPAKRGRKPKNASGQLATKKRKKPVFEGESDEDEANGGAAGGVSDHDSDFEDDVSGADSEEEAAAASRRAADAALSIGGLRCGPEDCAHLTHLVPRMPPPRPSTFTKIPDSPVFGIPRQPLALSDAHEGSSSASASASSGAGTGSAIGSQATGPMATAGAGLRLHPYQVEGLNWLLFNLHQDRGCILADVS